MVFMFVNHDDITTGVTELMAKKNAAAAAKTAPTPMPTPKGSTGTGTRTRLGNDNGQILMFTKKVGKNGAIRVTATISQKGMKPGRCGRETFTSHDEANKAMDAMVHQAEEKGWKIKTRSSSYSPKDSEIVIPDLDAISLETREEGGSADPETEEEAEEAQA